MGPNERGVRKEIRRLPAEYRNGGLAALALTLAKSIDSRPEPKDVAALAGRLQAVLVELAKFGDVTAAGGAVDDLNARRQKRRKGA